MSGYAVVTIVLALIVVLELRRPLIRMTRFTGRLALATVIWVARRVGRPVMAIRRTVRWMRRRTQHVLAYVGSSWSKVAGSWRHRSPTTRAFVRRLLSVLTVASTPVRWIARTLFRRVFGIERLVTGKRPVVAALGPSPAGREGPPLRTVYGERLDTLRVPFVIGDDQQHAVDVGREQIQDALAGSGDHIDRAVEGADQLALALISASEGRIDGIRGLVVPCAERATARFLGVGDEHGPSLFAAGQLLLHRVFLNPPSPLGLSDWYAERAAASGLGGFRSTLRDSVLRARLADLDGDGDLVDPTLIMLATALGPHVAWMTTHVLDELLRHPAHLGPLSAWADVTPPPTADGAPDTGDERVRLILEAMRLHPVVSGVVRACPHATDLHYGDTGRRPLRTGVTFVYTRTAEFDPAVAGRRSVFRFDPDRFRPDGPESPGPPTMSFGAGHHECLGRDIALRLMVTILGPLLAQEGVRRDPSRHGLLTTTLRKYSPLKASGTWPFPTNLYVVFEAGIRA